MKLTCPYCEIVFNEPNEHLAPGERSETDCPECEKYFAYAIRYEIITTSYKAECLNGGEHEWTTQTCYPEFMTQRVCPCGESEYIYKDQERQLMADKYYQDLKNSKLERFDV